MSRDLKPGLVAGNARQGRVETMAGASARELAKGLLASFLFRLQEESFRGRKKLAVLMYHSINPYVRHRLVVHPLILEAQIQWLKEDGWEVVSLTDLLFNGGDANEKTAVLTFDDGYEDNYIFGMSIFRKYSIAPTVFIVHDQIGKELPFPWFGASSKWAKSLSWQQIATMMEMGVEFGSHTLSHAHLTKALGLARLQEEIIQSKQLLEMCLGKADYFCYPAGVFDSTVKQVVALANYRAALSVKPGYVDEKDRDLLELPRIEISGMDSMETFRKKLEGVYIPWHRLVQSCQDQIRTMRRAFQ